MQGDIAVESELGVGSCFTIRLPAEPRGDDLADGPAQEAVDAALAAAEAHSRGLSDFTSVNPFAEKAVVNA